MLYIKYPRLAEAFPEISSLLQEKIDHVFKPGTQLMIVLCGSSLSFMEEQVLGYESPLYGRRTAQFRILPLDYSDALVYWPSMDREDAAICYGFTGGVPAYMELIQNGMGNPAFSRVEETHGATGRPTRSGTARP